MPVDAQVTLHGAEAIIRGSFTGGCLTRSVEIAYFVSLPDVNARQRWLGAAATDARARPLHV